MHLEHGFMVDEIVCQKKVGMAVASHFLPTLAWLSDQSALAALLPMLLPKLGSHTWIVCEMCKGHSHFGCLFPSISIGLHRWVADSQNVPQWHCWAFGSALSLLFTPLQHNCLEWKWLSEQFVQLLNLDLLSSSDTLQQILISSLKLCYSAEGGLVFSGWTWNGLTTLFKSLHPSLIRISAWVKCLKFKFMTGIVSCCRAEAAELLDEEMLFCCWAKSHQPGCQLLQDSLAGALPVSPASTQAWSCLQCPGSGLYQN